MEYMADLLAVGISVAFPLGIDALGGEKFPHRPGFLPKEIVAGGNDIGRREILCDGFQNPEPGIVGRCIFAQIVQEDPGPGSGCPLDHVVHTAV